MALELSHNGLWGRLRWWWKSRDWKSALFWSPALLIALGTTALAGMCLNTSEQELRTRYLEQAKSAFQAKDYARAMTCYERVVPMAEDRPDVLYRLALTAEAAGDGARAMTLMRELAPDDSKGYVAAHYWRARQFLSVSPQSLRTQALAEVHLRRALDGDFEDKETLHGLLGTICLNSGRLNEAEEFLSKARARNPDFGLALARVFAARGNLERARQEAEVAAKSFRDRSRSDPGNVALRLAWANAVTTKEDFKTAIEILVDGMAISEPALFRQCIARVYAANYEARKKAPGVAAGELISLLDQGLNHDPTNPKLLQGLIEQMRYGAAEADQVRPVLERQLAKGGTALAPIHFALAIDAKIRGRADEEQTHLEQAYRLDPKTGIIANNLAWVLIQAPTPDHTRALAIINEALDRDPANPTFLDTRGRIHLALGKWKDALADLEVVLQHAPATAGVHQALAEAYDKLGLRTLADEHRALQESAPPPKKTR